MQFSIGKGCGWAADWFPPVAALQHALEAVYSFTGLNDVVLCSRFVRGWVLVLSVQAETARVVVGRQRHVAGTCNLRPGGLFSISVPLADLLCRSSIRGSQRWRGRWQQPTCL